MNSANEGQPAAQAGSVRIQKARLLLSTEEGGELEARKQELIAIVGAENVLDDAPTLASYASDQSFTAPLKKTKTAFCCLYACYKRTERMSTEPPRSSRYTWFRA